MIDAFVDQLDLVTIGFAGVNPKETGRPSYHPINTVHSPVVGALKNTHGQAASQLQASKYIPLSFQFSVILIPVY